MNIPAAALKKMLDCGLSLADAIEVAELMRAPSKGAERQRRFREKAKAEGVTGDVTCNASRDVTPVPEQKVSPTPPSKTQTLSPSEPKGSSGKTTRARGTADFDAFWRAYPRREGKGAARSAFERAIGKIQGQFGHLEPLSVLLAGLERAKAMWRDPKFIPHPATWLNQERWTDEPTTILDFPKANDPKPSRIDERNDRAFAASEVAIARRTLAGEGCG